jgi:TRAP-type C4-dicarboxylate transport system permease small subunit
MGGFAKAIRFVSNILNIIAGIAVTFMMLLTVSDVLLRAGGRPIIGTFEIVALSLALVIGFAIPKVSLDRGHVTMDFLLVKISQRGRDMMNTFTRLLGVILFACIGYNLFNVAARFHTSGEVTATIKIPFYPVAYGVAICCLIECVVYIFDIVRIWRHEYE